MSLPHEDFEPENPSGELVHWMARPAPHFGPAELALAFAAGLAAGLALLALNAPAPQRIVKALPADGRRRRPPLRRALG
jgi:hypothetical protein